VSHAPSMHTVLSRIGETQAPLPAAAAVLVGLAALAVVSVQEIWVLARHVNVIAHEGAHAVIGSAVGRRVHGVTLQPNADGRTRIDSGTVPGTVTIGIVGYLGPSAFGLGAAKLIEVGHSVSVLWLALLLLAILLVLLRNFFGFFVVILTGLLLFMIARYAPVGVETVVAYGVTWFLLLSGVRMVLDDGIRAEDAGRLAGITHTRPALWVWLWLAGTVAALLVGGGLLV
jgi:Peptidase M50B-like